MIEVEHCYMKLDEPLFLKSQQNKVLSTDTTTTAVVLLLCCVCCSAIITLSLA